MKVALIGKSGTGKSEVASYLAEAKKIQLVKTGVICREISKLLFGNDKKSSTQLLDDHLTAIDPSIFLRAALREADLDKSFAIDALRFQSDLIIAREVGCKIIRIWAIDSVRISRLNERGQAFDILKDGRHRSETELDSIDVDEEIENNGTIEELRTNVESALKRL